MSSDNQFTALGPSAVGFQTHATGIDKGVDAFGNSIGVRGSSSTGDGVIGSTNKGGKSGVFGFNGGGTGVFGLSEHAGALTATATPITAGISPPAREPTSQYPAALRSPGAVKRGHRATDDR